MYKLRLSIAAALVVSSTFSVAGSYGVEARGSAMGGTGVVAANYLTAPFYNPALTAIYRRNDDAGMLLPSAGLVYNDEDGLADEIDALSDAIKLASSDAVTAATNAQLAMDNMDGTDAKLEFGGAVAFGIPNPYLAMNIFGKAYMESFVTPNFSSDTDTLTRAQNSFIEIASVGVAEAGISIAKYQTVLGQHMSFGISPKLQRVYSYAYAASATNYDLQDLMDNKNAETTFNIDAGAMWFYGPFRVGFSAMNLISRDVESEPVLTTGGASKTFTYKIQPQYTVGAGLVFDYFTISADYDLTEDTRFDDFEDNTQWLKAGLELDIMRQLQLRGGYKKNMAYEDSEGTFTAGIGLSPLGLFELDLTVSYTNEDAMGGYINFLTTY
ncbi:conjugal transfer protein TraF [Vibrio sp. HA2012]|uniref:conjugal transfer protein TraF n=1 Tax=Vibrio sp. HA2012 TaxID=1971595 RepID=UPI000C2C15FE|nr:conjugal transfer protein TraF [Vibrio sp. HA2012]PJC87417.1 conjugal transfer protein TraF [Vibrio sp. HA2012]